MNYLATMISARGDDFADLAAFDVPHYQVENARRHFYFWALWVSIFSNTIALEPPC